MLVRASATRCSHTECSAIFLPKASRDRSRFTIILERALGGADGAHAVMDAARAEAALRDLEAAALAQHHVLDRHAHVLEQHFAVAVRRVVDSRTPAACARSSRPACPSARESAIAGDICRVSGSVLPITIMILQRGSPTPDDHHLRPLMT